MLVGIPILSGPCYSRGAGRDADRPSVGWQQLKDDVRFMVSGGSGRSGAYQPVGTGDGDEMRGMLRTEQLEMSER